MNLVILFNGPLAKEININSGIGLFGHGFRANNTIGHTAKARKSYQDFLALWKDADSDIPIIKQDKAEYIKPR